MQPTGPKGQFVLLFDEEANKPPFLPEPFRRIYGGDIRALEHPDRPYTYINFVTSRDGRVSFSEPGHAGGSDVACFSDADTWLMALLRACADAVMMGEGTLAAEPDHLWTSEFIAPCDAEAFTALRSELGRSRFPLHVFLSLEGNVNPSAAVFADSAFQVLIATTSAGKERAEALLKDASAQIEVLDLGADTVDLHRLVRLLHSTYRVKSLLCEGGPRVYGSMLQAGLVDDEFLTLSPVMLGSDDGPKRPSLVEGVRFAPGKAPRSTLLSLRRVGDHLFMRSRWTYHH
jgi:5-amino-6-(5-phosphoribosylamino)uracil reductase